MAKRATGKVDDPDTVADESVEEVPEAPAPAEPEVVEDIRPEGHIRLEGGGFAAADGPFDPRDRQVKGKDGRMYDHVADHLSGDWIYRHHR